MALYQGGQIRDTVRPSGPLRVNNGDAMMPALIAGTGLGILPEFILREALVTGRLERLLPDWSLPLGAVYWVTPPGDRDRSLRDLPVLPEGCRIPLHVGFIQLPVDPTPTVVRPFAPAPLLNFHH